MTVGAVEDFMEKVMALLSVIGGLASAGTGGKIQIIC